MVGKQLPPIRQDGDMRPVVTGVAPAILTMVLAACSAEEPKSDDTSAPSPQATSSSTAPTGHPRFEEPDYTYVLRMNCYCPFITPVRITVEDGSVSSAVATEDGRSIRRGEEAPESLQLTINDIIDRAEDPDVAEVELDWPDGQAWPNRVRLDQIEGAVDDEITYVISDVDVG